MRPIHWFPVLLLLSLMFVGGCSKPKPPETAAAPAATAAPTGSVAGGGQDMVSCPVLGTTMAKSKMIPVEFEGQTYYVCCQDCVEKFKANPQKYLEHPAKPLPPSAGMSHGG